MSHKRLSVFVAVLPLVCAALPAAEPLGTMFTYQGMLQVSNSPVNGLCDLQFTLWDAAASGSSFGSTQLVSNLSVTNGQVVALLDFGAASFNGEARWLQVALRIPPGAGDFTVLAPRQRLTATPYALQAASALQVPATNLTGQLNPSQIPTNVTWLNLDQLFTGSNVFAGPAILTNSNNRFSGTFSGSFLGDGSGLTNLPSGTGAGSTNQPLAWEWFSGSVLEMHANRGYMAGGSEQVTFTLPAIVARGDIVRVAGAGVGGWKILQGTNDQIILTQPLGCAGGYYWVSNGPPGLWRSIASSTDGSRLVAVAEDHQVCLSTNSGRSWVTNDEISIPWQGVACSADGLRLVGGGSGSGSIFTSADGGNTWKEFKGKQVWKGFASSADGVKLVAAADKDYIYTSTDSGNTWSSPHGTSNLWTSVACSDDGTRVVAGVFSGPVYVSANSGVTWVPRGPTNVWTSVASSADGSRLAAVGRGQQIFISSDYGLNWVAVGPTASWTGVASSKDGSRLFAVEDNGTSGGYVHLSTDFGKSWSAHGTLQPWRCLAVSADGGKLVAATSGENTPGFIYTSVGTTSPGTTGGLMGGLDEAVELLYLGNNQFRVLSHEGSIGSF